ncbi:MAG: pyridoxal 5'-phosphate synthase glutaminase subunit PdxT [Xenococcaceae cyanobacterium]
MVGNGKVRVGVLAFQGCVKPHLEKLSELGVEGVPVRDSETLNSVERLILPGGESSTMLRFLNITGMFNSVKEFCSTHPVWGICAGSILLAKEVVNPVQASLEVIDIKAHRNFYGSQRESFKASVEVGGIDESGDGVTLNVDFIRAPLLSPLTSEVDVLATYQGQKVCMKQGNCLVSSFHTELGNSTALHQYFLLLS